MVKFLEVHTCYQKIIRRCEPHQAITLVSAYLVERGLILKPQEVENKSNEITAVPKLIESLALKGVVVSFDAMNTQKKPLRLS